MVTTMKHFEKHLRKLRLAASGLGFKLIFKPGVDDEMSYIRREIHIDSEQEDSEIIATLLHELGHAMSFSVHGRRAEKEARQLNSTFHYGKPTRNQAKKVIVYEQEAWQAGESLAGLLGIPLGKWFSETRESCLKSYTGWKK